LKLTNQNIYSEAGMYNGIFFVQEILRLNILAQDYHSNDDVLAISDSDSDTLETFEKADFVEFRGR